MERMIRIERVPPTKWRVSFEGKEIGVWRDPECSAARYLLDNNLAAPGDILQNGRGLSGSVGWFAKRTVREDEKEVARFTGWMPFPTARYRPGVASDESEVGE